MASADIKCQTCGHILLSKALSHEFDKVCELCGGETSYFCTECEIWLIESSCPNCEKTKTTEDLSRNKVRRKTSLIAFVIVGILVAFIWIKQQSQQWLFLNVTKFLMVICARPSTIFGWECLKYFCSKVL